MEPLLKIQSVPISMELHVENARLQLEQPSAQLDITRNSGGLTIESEPIRVRLDTFEARASAGLKSACRSIEEAAQKGVKMGYEAIGRIAEDGNFMMDIHLKGNTIPNLATKNLDLNLDTIIGFIPSTKPEIEWDGPELQMKYDMDKLAFDWRVNRPNVTFIPGNIEMEIKEFPKVIIEYIGEPIYVPPSAAPGFEAEA